MATAAAPGPTPRAFGPARERLSGSVEQVTFHNADTGFCVLRLKVRGQRDLVTLTGYAAAIGAGEHVEAEGVWLSDRNHGLQFKAERVKATVPTTLASLEKYLGSGMIRGIGPVYAAKLVGAFGHEVFEVIEKQPERLREVTGIGPVREAKIIRGWSDQRVIREIIVWLYSHGVSSARAVRIFKTYGEGAIGVIKADPYQRAYQRARDIAGIGFKTADAIASSIGYAKEDPRRVRAGVAHALTSAMDDGHCGLPRDDLVRSGAKLLEVAEPLIERALDGELASGEVVAGVTDGREVMFLAGLYRAEQSIAERLLRLRDGRLPWPAIDAEQAIPWVERKTGLELSPSQRDALRLALASKVCVITGGPGVGKTTLVNSVLKTLSAKRVAIALAAPTGRAAKRLAESSGMEAMTLHRPLETNPADGGFKRDEHNPLDCDLLVVDEASMVVADRSCSAALSTMAIAALSVQAVSAHALRHVRRRAREWDHHRAELSRPTGHVATAHVAGDLRPGPATADPVEALAQRLSASVLFKATPLALIRKSASILARSDRCSGSPTMRSPA